ncbi:MAG: GtrA family protein [Pseudomonadota bacterium]
MMSAFQQVPKKPLIQLLQRTSIRFMFVGGATAVIYFAILYFLLKLGMASWLAGIVAYILCFGLGYTGQKLFTFQSTSNHSTSLPRYAILQSLCLIFAAASGLTAETLGLTQPLTVALLTTAFLGIIAFTASFKWVFAK